MNPLTLALSLFTPVILCAAESSNSTNSISTNSRAARQPLTAKEAKRALERTHQPETNRGPGTWRYIDIRPNWENSATNLPYFTNTVYEWHRPGTRVLRRTERTESSKPNSTTSRPHVQVDNAEGSWALHDNVAIFFPPSGLRITNGLVKEAGGFKWVFKPIELDDSDPELAGDVEFTGERFQEEGRWLLRITTRHGEKFKIRYTRMIKKRIPLFLRPFLKTAELKKIVDEVVPVHYESVLDMDTCTVLVSRAYSNDGLLIFETQGWQPWSDLPPEDYAVPKDITRIRPKTLEEASRLDSQIPPGE